MRLAFVDLETTGATATADRITEIGIVEVDEDGVREWSSLVNPQTSIPTFIEALTGISNAMVARAPTFEELATEVHARLEGRIFVAHNARFDYSFLKQAFQRVGLVFKPTVLCTVKLSRRLYPGFARHNLDSLIERHRLIVSERHRALGDARLIWQFWQAAHEDLPSEQIQGVVKQLTTRSSLPSHLDATLIDELPSTAGVYLFYGESALLYIGKSKNLRQRVLSHFSGDHRSAKELEMSQQIRHIEWQETGGEVGALLQEARLVKQRSPTYNRLLRRNDMVCAWRIVVRGNQLKVALTQGEDLLFEQDSSVYGLFVSSAKASQALRSITEAHQLCPGLLGLEKIKPGKPCFASQVGRCLGACCGRELLSDHHQRLLQALQPLQVQAWPYSGPIGIREGSREKARLHLVDRWSYLGTAQDEADAWAQLASAPRQPRFDRDVYQILCKRLPLLAARAIVFGRPENHGTDFQDCHA